MSHIKISPDSHPNDFISKGANKINKNTKETWQKSNTRHSDKTGEWKVGIGKIHLPLKIRLQ